jgi:hypothetical protein
MTKGRLIHVEINAKSMVIKILTTWSVSFENQLENCCHSIFLCTSNKAGKKL